jgi:hypothetical protein
MSCLYLTNKYIQNLSKKLIGGLKIPFLADKPLKKGKFE